MSMQLLRNSLRNFHLTRTMSFYAVARGNKVGIYDTWMKCEQQVSGFKGAKYKKCPTREAAEMFIKTEGWGDVSSGARDKVAKKFSPQAIAVPLGTKGPAVWKQEDLNQYKETSTVKTPQDFWPESDDDDSVEESAEWLAAVAQLEKNIAPAPSTLKRKSESSSSSASSKVPKHSSKIWHSVGVKKIGDFVFQVDEQDYVIVYTDGSCLGNGQKNAAAGYGVYFGDNHPLNAAKPVLGRVTNNVGEIQAAIHSIKEAQKLGIRKLCISTDSQFLINAITTWVKAWKVNGWCLKNKKPVKNVADFKELDELLADDKLLVKWNYVKAHKGIKGNEMADKLAREGSDIYRRQNSK